MKVDFSNFLNLNITDLVKGLIMTVIGAAVSAIYTAIDSGGIDWHVVWKVSLAAGLSYIIKNFFTPPPSTVVVDRDKTDIEVKK